MVSFLLSFFPKSPSPSHPLSHRWHLVNRRDAKTVNTGGIVSEGKGTHKCQFFPNKATKPTVFKNEWELPATLEQQGSLYLK